MSQPLYHPAIYRYCDMMLIENGFSSRRVESFPVGLRVLVVDDDPTWLKILEKMLKKCAYEVTTCGLAREALKLLRERKDGFDIVISDVNMPDMDGFNLLEYVGLEMDLPVIMMSVDGETSRVMKGVQHGACDYLLKPIRMKELRNIWQHVFRKRMHEVRDIESSENFEDTWLFRQGMEISDDGHSLSSGEKLFIKKRKDVENKHDDRTLYDNGSIKKPRVMWSVDLHQKFVKAVNQIGFDKVGPKKILDLMNVPWLTRENVASHLQKYRLYLSRLQKENELKISRGASDKPAQFPQDTGGNISMQSSSSCGMQQTEDSFGNLRSPAYKLQIRNTDSKSDELDLKIVNLLPSAEQRESLNCDNSLGPHKANGLEMRLDHSSGSVLEDKINSTPVDLTSTASYPWLTYGEVSDFPFEIDFKPCQQEVFDLKLRGESQPLDPLDHSFDYHSVYVPQKHIGAANIHPNNGGIGTGQSVCESNGVAAPETQLPSVRNSNNNIKQSLSMERENASFFQLESSMLRSQASEFCSNTTLDTSNNNPLHFGLSGFELGQVNQVLGYESAAGPLTDDSSICSLQGDNYASNLGFNSTGYSEHGFPDVVHEAPTICLYGLPRFDLEYPYDLVEYPVVDQGLYIS